MAARCNVNSLCVSQWTNRKNTETNTRQTYSQIFLVNFPRILAILKGTLFERLVWSKDVFLYTSSKLVCVAISDLSLSSSVISSLSITNIFSLTNGRTAILTFNAIFLNKFAVSRGIFVLENINRANRFPVGNIPPIPIADLTP